MTTRHRALLVLILLGTLIPSVLAFQTRHVSKQQLTLYKQHDGCRNRPTNPAFPTFMSNKNDDSSNTDFWQQQRALLNEMTDKTDRSLKAEQLQQFRQTQSKLVGETAFVSALLFALLWLACDNPFVPFSYVFGSVFGLAYTYGLGKYVETLGGTAEDASAVQGAGVGQARFAFLILLFVLVGKLRAFGLIEIPSILGFFTYQIASLTQGLREDTS